MLCFAELGGSGRGSISPRCCSVASRGTLKIRAGGATGQTGGDQTSYQVSCRKPSFEADGALACFSVLHKNAPRKVYGKLGGSPSSFPARGRMIGSPPCRRCSQQPASWPAPPCESARQSF